LTSQGRSSDSREDLKSEHEIDSAGRGRSKGKRKRRSREGRSENKTEEEEVEAKPPFNGGRQEPIARGPH